MKKIMFIAIFLILGLGLVLANQNPVNMKEKACFGEGENLGPAIAGNVNKCCSGLVAEIPPGYLVNKGTCKNKSNSEKEKIDFTPWQKRNESECLEGCKCHGAVMSCETENGKILNISTGSGKNIIIEINKSKVETSLNISLEDGNKTRLKVKAKNGSEIIIKIMPDTAAERAIARLGLKLCNESNNCSIVLKDVGKGNETRLKYEIKATKKVKFLFWKWNRQVKTEVDA